MTILLSLSELFGGLALFLFGLRQLSQGLGTVAGHRLRILLEWSTRHRLPAYALGTSLGFLLHSSGATVMMVGFLNAGLIRLAPLLPVLFGVNLGTTLSMQVLSLNLDALTYPAIALGMALSFHRNEQKRAGGQALFGFGLLFLGMAVMGDAVTPYQEQLRPILAGLDTASPLGYLTALLASLLITAVLQSSGATIGMTFALIQGGVITSLHQAFPLVLGAHIGTCITAGLASIGGVRSARQLALAHLCFNLFNVLLATLMQRPLIQALESTSEDLIRQTANLHTGVMLTASLVLLPFACGFARLVHALLPARGMEETQSFLTPEAMASVDSALTASRREIMRLAELALESLSLCQLGLHSVRRHRTNRIQRNEAVFDTIKATLIRELRERGHDPSVTRADLRALDEEIRRITQIERIGDHLKSLYLLTLEQRSEPGTLIFGRKLNQELEHLFEATQTMLTALAQGEGGLHTQRLLIQETAERARSVFTLKMDAARIQPRVYYYYSGYLELFERLARHIELAGTGKGSSGTPA